MDSKTFFAALRRRGSGVFGTSLSQPQVDGINAILASCIRNGVTDSRHVANILAQVYHETGGYMLPIKETVQAYHRDKNPSDATVIARLDNAWKKGLLGNVSKPYWRDGWFGRGPIQVTHRDNYLRMGSEIGVDLVRHPEKLLDPAVGADSAVVGMARGIYRRKKLADYFNEARNDPAAARDIVNGDVKKNGGKIASYHAGFLAALKEAGWTGMAAVPEPDPLGKDLAEALDRTFAKHPSAEDKPAPRRGKGLLIAVLALVAIVIIFNIVKG